MVQYIYLIREKQLDIYVLYIMEFLKFIGCIIGEYVCVGSVNFERRSCSNQDANIFLGLSNDKKEEVKKILISKDDCVDVYLEFSLFRNNRKFDKKIADGMLERIIKAIWTDEVGKEILFLKDIYSANDLFFFLYNEGNIKFVEDYYPISGKEDQAVKIRQNAYERSFGSFALCYKQLKEKKDREGILSPYSEYALLLTKYKLNELVMLLDKRNLFLLDKLLEQIDEIREAAPDFVRLDYLAGSICKRDKQYWYKTEMYYNRAISTFEEKNTETEWISFIYYQLGRFYETKWGDLEEAYPFYEKAAEQKANYRPRFKLLKRAESRHEAKNIEEYANQLIKQLLNGYEISSVMPKERIYAYKCFNVLGGSYFEQGKYDKAKECYELAMKVSEEGSEFYDAFSSEENVCFVEIFRSCMPVLPILSRLISCYTKLHRFDDAEYCWEKRKMIG